MTALFREILLASLSGAILAGILVLAKRQFKERISKKTYYYLWLLVLLRLLLPISIEVNPGLGMEIEKYMAHSTVDSFVPLSFTESTVISTSSQGGSPTLPEIENPAVKFRHPDYFTIGAKIIWPGGMVLSLLFTLVSNHMYMSKLRKSFVEPDEYMKAAFAQVKGKKQAALQISPLVKAPMLAGLLHPVVILPQHNYGNQDMHYALLHESVHLDRRDVLYKWLVSIVTAIHWFNPLVYLMGNEIARACELACDEAVIRHMGGEEKIRYGEALLNFAEAGTSLRAARAVSMCEEKKHLKFRLNSIMAYSDKNKRRILPILAIVAILVSITAFSTIRAGNNKNPGAPDIFEIGGAQYRLKEMQIYATDYLGDNTAVSHLAALLPAPSEDLVYSHIEIGKAPKEAEAGAPQGYAEGNMLRVYYKPIENPIMVFTDTEGYTDLPQPESFRDSSWQSISHTSAYALMCFIGNVEDIWFGITAQYGGDTNTNGMGWATLISSHHFDKQPGPDLVKEDMGALMENLVEIYEMHRFDGEEAFPENSAPWRNKEYERLLVAIMSEPAYSSNPGDYIEENMEAYDRLIGMGCDILPNLLGSMRISGGLSAHIAAIACEEILTSLPAQDNRLYEEASSELHKWKAQQGYE